MGYIYAHVIERAARHLLELLREQTELPYSTFYDGTGETSDQLQEVLDFDSPEAAMDLAVAQLEGQGVVETAPLDLKLADEEQDYAIRLTAKGSQWLKKPFALRFHDAE